MAALEAMVGAIQKSRGLEFQPSREVQTPGQKLKVPCANSTGIGGLLDVFALYAPSQAQYLTRYKYSIQLYLILASVQCLKYLYSLERKKEIKSYLVNN